MVDDVVKRFGRLDILINDAAYNKSIPFKDLDNLTYEEWTKIIDINLTGPMLTTKAVGPVMKKQGSGRIVNISSVAGLGPTGSSIAYAVSKAGLIHLTKCMAVALAPEVLVNCVAPGPARRHARDGEPAAGGGRGQQEGVAARRCRRQGRLRRPGRHHVPHQHHDRPDDRHRFRPHLPLRSFAMSNQSGITFTHCAVTAAAAEHGHGHSHPRRREVVVAGKRVKTVDIHAHCCVPKAMAVINHPLEAPGLLMEDTSTRIAAMDSAGHRRRMPQHQSLLVPRRQGRGGRADPPAERGAGRVLRQAARPLRRLRDGGAAASRTGGRAGRACGEEARLPRRQRRRQRRRPRAGRSEVQSVLGEVRGARRPGLPASDRHARARAERPSQRQRPADQHDRQSARDDDRAVASDLRGHARPFPRPQDLRRAWRRLPAAPTPTARMR